MHFSAYTLAATLALASTVSAHATAQPPVGIPSKSMVVGIRIPHGCNHNATTSLTVKIPANITGPKAQYIPGWNVTTTLRPLDPPVTSDGVTVNTTVDTITWSGGELLDSQYLDFGVSVRLPPGNDGDVVPFEATQFCKDNNETNYWNGTLAPKVVLMKNGTLLTSSDFNSTGGSANGGADAAAGTTGTAKDSKSAALVSFAGSFAGAAAAVGGAMLFFM
ncbi:uncharacterized protein EV422DRAFT_525034 [Fimicolochytrium jonesii]|uniref:uncharacterized protein n=1 Tax=Fimicolochytrium jonesii TaxID=1396493 RepID=UPI0022FE7907|nr:uncharacterized protein EV422DRAFT_525034 [Fimicolochytrium jonesii]KAI8822689.1 hypothetical protein EV422DRAFT_525034 [Fimicolochytrium jonesii]